VTVENPDPFPEIEREAERDQKALEIPEADLDQDHQATLRITAEENQHKTETSKI
jgi:hypothetical protein